MLEEKANTELSAILAEAGVDEAIDTINAALKNLGQAYRVDTISFVEDEAESFRPCRCTRRGIIGYDESCTIVNGKRTCRRVPRYGCMDWDCT